MHALILLIASLANAGAAGTCVESMKYPQSLMVPAVEVWASDSAIFGGSAEVECNLTNQLVGLFKTLQNKIAKENADQRPLRGTHAKGVCVRGTVQPKLDSTLNMDQVSALQQAGLFQTNGPLNAQFRFANASSRIKPDWKADVRALSMKIALPNGGEQDFAFNNVPRFQINSLDGFVRVMEMQEGMMNGEITIGADGAPSKLDLFNYFRKRYGSASAARYLLNLKKIGELASADSLWHPTYTGQTYWSTTAFAVGQSATIAKFGAQPCAAEQGKTVLASENEARELGRSENYLRESLAAKLTQAPVCFNLFVQFLDEEKSISKKTKAVEDPSLIWQAPVHLVAQLRMTEVVDQSTCDDPRQAVSVSTHANGIYGIGQINRAREFAEAASWKNR